MTPPRKPPVVPSQSRSFLTARQIFRATPSEIHERARYVTVKSIRVTPDRLSQRPTFVANTQTVKVEGGRMVKGNTYTTTLKVGDKQNHVIVECTCGFHPFWGVEYVLHTHGAAEIIHSNGQRPRIKNPEEKIFACKHLIALISKLISKKAI